MALGNPPGSFLERTDGPREASIYDQAGPLNPDLTANQDFQRQLPPQESVAPEQAALAQGEGELLQNQQRAQRGSAGGGFEDAGYYPTQQELYPGQPDVMIGRTTQVGKYGGAPIFYGGSNILPLGVVSGKLKAIADERAALKKQADGLDLYAGIEDLKNPNYRKVQNQYIAANLGPNSPEYQRWREFYGDDIKFRAALNTKGSAAHNAYFGRGGLIDSVNTLAKMGNFAHDLTEEYIDGVDKGLYEKTADYDRAIKYREGSAYGGDPRQMLKDFNSFRPIAEANKYFKDNGINDQFLKVVEASKMDTGPRMVRVPGGTAIMIDRHTSGEQIKKLWAENLKKTNPTFKQLDLDRIEGLFPDIQGLETKMTIQDDYHPPASSSSESTANKSPKYGYVVGSAPVFNTSDVWSGGKKTQVPTITFSEDIGGKNRPMGTLIFEDKNQNPIRLAGVRLQKRGNEWVAVGSAIDEKRVAEYERLVEGYNGDEELAQSDALKLNIAKRAEVPYNMNRDRFRSYMGKDFDPDAALQQQGGQQQSVAPVAQSAPSPDIEKQVKAAYPEAVYDGGVWKVQVNGKWKKLNIQ
jgi:hypothetical protein